MRNILAVVLCLGLFATAANAQDSMLHLYFSTTGPGSVVPPEYADEVNPVVQCDGTCPECDPCVLYLWAYVETGDLWNGLALRNLGFCEDGSPCGDAIGGELYNGTFPGGYGQRWEMPESDLDPVGDNYIFGFAVQAPAFGLGHVLEGAGDYHIGQHYLVAQYEFNCGECCNIDEDGDGYACCSIFLGPGLGGISRSGSDPGDCDVYFGWGDAPLPDNANTAHSELPDAYCCCYIPEPASMLLLGLAGLFLRRR